jgi:hypothetical protein
MAFTKDLPMVAADTDILDVSLSSGALYVWQKEDAIRKLIRCGL